MRSAFTYRLATAGALAVTLIDARAIHAQAVPATPEAPPRPTMTALRMDAGDSILVDGVLDDAAWQRARPATGFMQLDPRNGEPATEGTEVRIVYDHNTFYMGVTCHDSEPDKLLRFQQRRDEFLQADDRFMWVIDPFLTAQNGYFFETNPSGLMGDALVGPAGQNRQWDGIWNLRVSRTSAGWSLEIAIPFTTLNFDPSATAWGINFQRTVRRRNEDSLWSGWGRNQGLMRLANAGRVVELNRNVSQGVGLEVRPYLVGTVESSPVTGKPATEGSGKVGVDVSYSLTPGLRSNFTVNTDFAQTEVDQRAVNLTRFPLFFPEKRTFFLEGASYFEFGTVSNAGNSAAGGFTRPVDNSIVPFFSRRIGLDADGNPQRIDYGVKLIGQIGRGQDIGVLQVQTADDNGDAGEQFTAMRMKRRFWRQSYVGALYTARYAASDGGGARQTVGADFQLATSALRGSQNATFSGYYLRNTNPPGGGGSASYGLKLDYPNDRWNAGVSYRNVQDNFNPSLGFTLRSGYKRYNPYLNFSYRPRDSRRVRRMGFTADVDLQTDSRNDPLTRLATLTVLNVDFQTQDTMSMLVVPEYERLNRTFAISPGITLPAGREYSFLRYRVAASTANRRVIAVSPVVEWGGFYSGTRQQFAVDVTVRARPGVIVYVSNEWNRVNLAEGSFRTRLLRLTPELQVGQWVSFVNTVQYDSVSAVLGWQSRFRWILKPGNDLFIVYSQNWRDEASLDRWTVLNRRAASKILYAKRF